ncbi:hypothetical protein [Streptomyces kronopolitis]|uniref:hypothetical protein n=1 Tax=Streptomyces kronopolitis TaxID=1612435 RepID=UPI00343F1954
MSSVPPASGKKSLRGRSAGLILIAVVVLASAVFVIKGLTAAGLTGTPGTFTVADCFPHHSSSSGHSRSASHEYDCDGSYRSDDGETVDAEASLSSIDTDHHTGTRLAVQGHHDSAVLSALSGATYTLAGRGEITKSFVIAFSILLLVPLLLLDLLTGFGETGGTLRQWRQKWRATAGTRTRTLVLTTGGVILFGTLVVSPVLGVVLAP